MGGVSNAVGQSSNQPNQQPQYGQQGLGGMVQGAGNAIGGMMQSPFMGQIGQAISGQQPTQSGLTNFPYNSGTPSYDLVPQQSQGIANVNPGIGPTPEQDALIRQQMAQLGMSPNQPLNPYMSGTPSYGQMPQGSPLIYRSGIDQYQTAPNSQEFSNVSNVIGQMPQPMGQPAQNSYTPQPKVMPAYPGSQPMLPQNIQQLLGQPQRGFPQQGMPQRGFPKQSMLAQALRKGV